MHNAFLGKNNMKPASGDIIEEKHVFIFDPWTIIYVMSHVVSL